MKFTMNAKPINQIILLLFIFFSFSSYLHGKGGQRYSGTIGNQNADFQLKWHETGEVTGHCLLANGEAFELKGDNHQEGNLRLNAVRDGASIGSAHLKKSVEAGAIRWSGQLSSIDGESLSVNFERESHKKNEQQYSGKIGKQNAVFLLDWKKTGEVIGRCEFASGEVYDLKGDNHQDGVLRLNADRDEAPIGSIHLTKSVEEGSIRWSGALSSIDGERHIVWLERGMGENNYAFQSNAQNLDGIKNDSLKPEEIILVNQETPEKTFGLACVNANSSKFAIIQEFKLYIYELPSGRLLTLWHDFKEIEELRLLFYHNSILYGITYDGGIFEINGHRKKISFYRNLKSGLFCHSYCNKNQALLCTDGKNNKISFVRIEDDFIIKSLDIPLYEQGLYQPNCYISDSFGNVIGIGIYPEESYYNCNYVVKINIETGGKCEVYNDGSCNEAYITELHKILEIPDCIDVTSSSPEFEDENVYNYILSFGHYNLRQTGVCFKPDGKSNLVISNSKGKKIYTFGGNKKPNKINYISKHPISNEIITWGVQPFIDERKSYVYKFYLDRLDWKTVSFDENYTPINFIGSKNGLDWTYVTSKKIPNDFNLFGEPLKIYINRDGAINHNKDILNFMPWVSPGEEYIYYDHSFAVCEARSKLESIVRKDTNASNFTFYQNEDTKKYSNKGYDIRIPIFIGERKVSKLIALDSTPIGIHKIGDFYIIGTEESIIVVNNINGNFVSRWQLPRGWVTRQGHLWNYPNGKLDIKLLVSEKMASNDERREIYFMNNQGGILVFSLLDTGELNLACVVTVANDGKPLFYCDDQLYFSLSSTTEGVHFSDGDKSYPFEQFDLRLNRPDIVMERIGVADEAVAIARQMREKRLKRMGVTEEMLKPDFHVPEIEILGSIPLSSADSGIEISIKAQDTKYPLERLKIFVNNVPINGRDGESLREANIQSLVRSIPIKLGSGRNKIQVSVLNSAGAESLYANAEITCTAERAKPRLFAVAMGVSEYANSEWNLKYAAKDAKDLIECIRSRSAANYGAVKELLLTDSAVTKESMVKIREFLSEATIDDTVVLFVAGHGLLDDKYDYYFGTSDIDFKDPSARGIAYEEFDDLLASLPSLKKSLLIDTCHAGELDDEEKQMLASTQPSSNQVVAMLPSGARGMSVAPVEGARGKSEWYDRLQGLFVDLRRGSGSTILSSSAGAEYALESSEQKNGLFTYAVLEALDGKGDTDSNKDGLVQMSEITQYVKKRVSDLSNNKQTPNIRRVNLEGDFAVTMIK